MLSAANWCCTSGLQPRFDLGQIPHDASGRKRKAQRKFTALLHLVDGAVGKPAGFNGIEIVDEEEEHVAIGRIERRGVLRDVDAGIVNTSGPVQHARHFPLIAIDEAVGRIKDGTITGHIYDPKTARLVRFER